MASMSSEERKKYKQKQRKVHLQHLPVLNVSCL